MNPKRAPCSEFLSTKTEYAGYAEYAKYAEYVEYAEYAEYTEYAEYHPVVFLDKRTKI